MSPRTATARTVGGDELVTFLRPRHRALLATTRAVPQGGVQTGRAATETGGIPVLPVAGGLVLLTAAAVMIRKGRLAP